MPCRVRVVTDKEVPPQRRSVTIHLRALLRSLVLKPRVHTPPCSSSLIHKMPRTRLVYVYNDGYWWLPSFVRSYYIVEVDEPRTIWIEEPPFRIFDRLFALFGNIADVIWVFALAAFLATLMLPPMMDIIIYLSFFYIAVSALHTRPCLYVRRPQFLFRCASSGYSTQLSPSPGFSSSASWLLSSSSSGLA